MTENDKLYDDAEAYWKTVPATVGGMLGGYGHISSTDVVGSKKFIRRFLNNGTGCKRALDCGAGIGRITKRVLLPIFDTVDMVELNQEFLDKAKSYLGENATRIGHYFCSGLQTFYPERDHYDVIWCQWVLGHLPDDDLVSFLQRCRTALTKNGIIVIKENIALTETPVFDDEDSSYTRPRNNLVDIIQQAGLVLLNEETQKDFPSDIFKVLMFAVQ